MNKKEALLILDNKNINNSEIKFIIGRKYCVYNKEKLMVDMELILKEFECCIKVKGIGEGNYITHGVANEEYFSAIYVGGELYLKVEDDNESI